MKLFEARYLVHVETKELEVEKETEHTVKVAGKPHQRVIAKREIEAVRRFKDGCEKVAYGQTEVEALHFLILSMSTMRDNKVSAANKEFDTFNAAFKNKLKQLE